MVGGCYYRCSWYLDFRCYSNLTEESSQSAIIISYSDNVYSSLNNSNVYRLVPSGIRYYRSMNSYTIGVITCRFIDINGAVVDASIGLHCKSQYQIILDMQILICLYRWSSTLYLVKVIPRLLFI